MNILLLGANGQVGWELRRTLGPLGTITTCARSTNVDEPLDISDLPATASLLDRIKPDVIVNAAAYTAVDQAESEPETAALINAELPTLLGRWAADHGALVGHYSTDYVFDGSKDTPYTEHDTPNPLGIYGRTKLAGDDALIDSGCDALILRVSWVYGNRGKNFMRTMQKFMAERDELRIVDDQFGAPTWCRRIAEATSLAVAQILASPENRLAKTGLYHFAPSGETSWFGFASAIATAGNYQCRLTPISTEEWPTPVQRPASSRFSTEKYFQTFALEPSTWHDDLAACMQEQD